MDRKKMTDEQILKQAIEKAVKNGYDEYYINYGVRKTGNHFIVTRMNPGGERFEMDYERVIFDHDFAKALFGEEEMNCWSLFIGEEVLKNTKDIKDLIERQPRILAWQYHLQQLVLLPNDERMQYIKRFL